jgi:hypothetical protein
MAEVATTSGVLRRRPETKKKPLNPKRNLKTKKRGDDDYHPSPPSMHARQKHRTRRKSKNRNL